MPDEIKNLSVRSEDAEVVDNQDDERTVYQVGELLDLTEEQITKIKKRLKKEIKDWKADTSILHTQLEDDNNLLEGVLEDTDFPFEGCANYDTGISEIYMGIYTNFLEQSIMGSGVVWTSAVEPVEDSPLTTDVQVQVEDMMNYKFFNEWNGREGTNDGIHIACRDGLSPIEVSWIEEYEEIRDVIMITSAEEFDQEFPDASAMGDNEDDYNEWKAKALEATGEEPLEIPVTYDRLVYRGNYYEAIDRINFVCFPATAVDITARFCRGYGKRFTVRRGVIKKYVREGYWYEDAADKCLKKKQETKPTGWLRSRDEIEGLKRSTSNNVDEPEFFEVSYRMELEKGKGERKLLLVYSYDMNELVSAKNYPYRRDHYGLLRIDKRPNRMAGKSVISKCREAHLQINETTNMRHNTRIIVNVPSFKAKAETKQDFDPNAPENKWRPGVTFWLKDIDSFEQFKVQPTDLGESMQEDHNTISLLDMKLGTSSQLMSGQSQQGNKSASGAKTQALLQQSFMRLEKPLDQMRLGIAELGNISLSHLYQFGNPIITYQSPDQTGNMQTQKLPKKFLRSGVKMNMAATSVAHSPDTELQRELQIHGIIMQEPLVQQDAGLRVESLRMALKKGRVKNVDKRLPPPAVIHQRQVQMAKEAMMQMQKEKMMAEEKMKQEAVKNRLQQVKQNMDIKKTSQQAAETGMGMPEVEAPAPVNGMAA